MLAVQPLQEGGKAGCFDLADWEDQHLHPRRGDRQQGVCTHGSESIPSFAKLYRGAVGMLFGLMRMSTPEGQ